MSSSVLKLWCYDFYCRKISSATAVDCSANYSLPPLLIVANIEQILLSQIRGVLLSSQERRKRRETSSLTSSPDVLTKAPLKTLNFLWLKLSCKVGVFIFFFSLWRVLNINPREDICDPNTSSTRPDNPHQNRKEPLNLSRVLQRQFVGSQKCCPAGVHLKTPDEVFPPANARPDSLISLTVVYLWPASPSVFLA